MDGARHDFKGIKATGEASPDGDKAFDADEFASAMSLPGLQVVTI